MSFFHEGDVQSGITAALQQGKAVVCFVRGDDAESDLWGSQWLVNAQDSLTNNAICLCIQSGSQEASQLAAFYAISQTPTVFIIRAGKLIDQLLPGLSQDSFSSRLEAALEQSASASPAAVSGQSSPRTAAPGASTIQTPQDSLSHTAPVATSQASAQPAADVSTSQHGREGRLRPSREESYMDQQARRKAEAAQERDRVRALIEADKRERKERERQRRAQATDFSAQEHESVGDARPTARPTRNSNETSSTVQVRLLDGSTMRQRFNASDTLRGAVRGWIDQNRSDADAPYTLKLVLTPMPSRAISDTDESRTLKDLGLLPNASMVLVPVRNFTQAYQAGGLVGFVKGAPRLLLGYCLAFMAFVWLAVTNAFRAARAPRETQSTDHAFASEVDSGTSSSKSTQVNTPRADAGNPGIRIRTLRDQRAGRDEQQLYNGNQLNFEPKKAHDEDP